METKRLGSWVKTTLQKSVQAKTEKDHGPTRSWICGGRYGTLKTQFLSIVKRHAHKTAFGKERVTVISYGKFSRVLFHPSIGPFCKELTVEWGSKAACCLCFFCFVLFFFVFFVRLLNHRLDLASVFVNSTQPSLTMLFNKSLLIGILPGDWKLTNIVAIFKKGKRDFYL